VVLRSSVQDEDSLMDRELPGEGRQVLWTEDTPVTPLTQATRPNLLEQLLQQAGVLAKQVQRERANLEGSSRAGGRPALKALEQQLVQVWTGIRAARSPGSVDTEVVRRRPKWD